MAVRLKAVVRITQNCLREEICPRNVSPPLLVSSRAFNINCILTKKLNIFRSIFTFRRKLGQTIYGYTFTEVLNTVSLKSFLRQYFDKTPLYKDPLDLPSWAENLAASVQTSHCQCQAGLRVTACRLLVQNMKEEGGLAGGSQRAGDLLPALLEQRAEFEFFLPTLYLS